MLGMAAGHFAGSFVFINVPSPANVVSGWTMKNSTHEPLNASFAMLRFGVSSRTTQAFSKVTSFWHEPSSTLWEM